MGFEPATACLQNRCSTIELRRRTTIQGQVVKVDVADFDALFLWYLYTPVTAKGERGRKTWAVKEQRFVACIVTARTLFSTDESQSGASKFA